MSTNQLVAALRQILSQAERQENPSLDKPTEFAIAQDRGMKLGDIRRTAREALAAFEASGPDAGEAGELPPLPACSMKYFQFGEEPTYTADQMQAYARAALATPPLQAPAAPMTLKEFCAEADRIGLTGEVFAAQLAERPEFADCVKAPSKVFESRALEQASKAAQVAMKPYRDAREATYREDLKHATLLPASPLQEHPEPFQQRVGPWLLACFGAEIAADPIERNHRFVEEALELAQACECTQSEAHQLVDYVFGRPVGEKAQEVGGVMVTLAALCRAHSLDMHAAGETELTRIWTKVEKIRAKQAAKPKHSPLPVAPLQEQDKRDAERYRWIRNQECFCESPPSAIDPDTGFWHGVRITMIPSAFDAAIDAAIQAKSQGVGS